VISRKKLIFTHFDLNLLQNIYNYYNYCYQSLDVHVLVLARAWLVLAMRPWSCFLRSSVALACVRKCTFGTPNEVPNVQVRLHLGIGWRLSNALASFVLLLFPSLLCIASYFHACLSCPCIATIAIRMSGHCFSPFQLHFLLRQTLSTHFSLFPTAFLSSF